MKKNFPIGEFFILGFRGPVVPDWLKRFSDRYGLGGVIIFDYDIQTRQYRNNVETPDQLRALCAQIHSLSSQPLVCIDQEGGKVRRLKEKLGFAPLPSAKASGSLEPKSREAIFRRAFAELVDLGIDQNLAPVCDVDYNPHNPDIGAVERSASAEISVVDAYASDYIALAEEAGLLACLKHYPGIGHAEVNSHEELMPLPMPGAKQIELFDELLRKMRNPCVLLSHALCPGEASHPVSMTAQWAQRAKLKVPDTVLMTDDLQMQALQRVCSSREASERAIRAGVDAVVIGNNLKDEQDEMEGIASILATEIASLPGIDQRLEGLLSRKRNHHAARSV